MMTRAYVVTEGPVGARLLTVLLPQSVRAEVEVFDSGGSSASRSAARTLLSAQKRPVALVVDAETDDLAAIRERYATLYDLLDMASPGIRFEVFLAVPEIEVLLVQDRAFLEQLTGQTLPDEAFEAARSQPKKFLRGAFGGSDLPLEKALATLTEETIRVLRDHRLIRELTRFLRREIMIGWFVENDEGSHVLSDELQAILENHFPDADPEIIREVLEILQRESDPEWIGARAY